MFCDFEGFGRSSWGGTTLLAAAAFVLCACGGPEFTGRGSSNSAGGRDAKGGSGGAGGAGGAYTQDSGGASGEASTTTASACGSLRNAPDEFQVDLCIEAGTFSMGSMTDNLATGHAAHSPVHDVTLAAFRIDAFEVTVARYRQCVQESGCSEPGTDAALGCTYTQAAGDSESLPISCIDASQAAEFCAWDEGRRLPTEAEWERVASGASPKLYPWGDTFDCEHAVLGSTSACKSQYEFPMEVGSHKLGQSADGLYDLSGNVSEWVRDWAGAYPAESVVDPQGPSSGTTRIIRGGSYKSLLVDGQTFVRQTTGATAVAAIGVRCAKDAE